LLLFQPKTAFPFFHAWGLGWGDTGRGGRYFYSFGSEKNKKIGGIHSPAGGFPLGTGRGKRGGNPNLHRVRGGGRPGGGRVRESGRGAPHWGHPVSTNFAKCGIRAPGPHTRPKLLGPAPPKPYGARGPRGGVGPPGDPTPTKVIMCKGVSPSLVGGRGGGYRVYGDPGNRFGDGYGAGKTNSCLLGANPLKPPWGGWGGGTRGGPPFFCQAGWGTPTPPPLFLVEGERERGGPRGGFGPRGFWGRWPGKKTGGVFDSLGPKGATISGHAPQTGGGKL